jgi:hypothetical protein
MAEKHYDRDDPFTMVGVAVPGDGDADLVNMACAFAEEFLRMGWPAERVLALFRSPFYQGPHAVYRAKGEEWVKALLASAT